MFTAVLFTITKLWNQHKCPTTDEWIEKNVYVHSGVLFGHKKEIMSVYGKRMELEIIMWGEVSQAKKDKYHIFSCRYIPKK
jgi:hypothetical protein